jgi:hypothetical protein
MSGPIWASTLKNEALRALLTPSERAPLVIGRADSARGGGR